MDDQTKARAKGYIEATLAANARVDVWLEMASIQVSPEYFGDAYALALCYFASHVGTLETRGSGDEVGSLTSKREGAISVSYSPTGGGTDDDLLQTTWGRMYLNLRQNCRPVPALTGFAGF